MNKEQYEAAHTILGFCRIFADQMSICLDNSGLRQLGYHLELDFDPCRFDDGKKSIAKVMLHKDIGEVGGKEWWESALVQRHWTDEGWLIVCDPYAKTNSLPEDVRYPEDRDERTGMAKKADHPYPPDGFWVGADYADPVLDGGQ